MSREGIPLLVIQRLSASGASYAIESCKQQRRTLPPAVLLPVSDNLGSAAPSRSTARPL